MNINKNIWNKKYNFTFYKSILFLKSINLKILKKK